MKVRKLLSVMLVLSLLATLFAALPALPVAAEEIVYTAENGWTLGTNAAEQQDGSLQIGTNRNDPTLFTPDME